MYSFIIYVYVLLIFRIYVTIIIIISIFKFVNLWMRDLYCNDKHKLQNRTNIYYYISKYLFFECFHEIMLIKYTTNILYFFWVNINKKIIYNWQFISKEKVWFYISVDLYNLFSYCVYIYYSFNYNFMHIYLGKS